MLRACACVMGVANFAGRARKARGGQSPHSNSMAEGGWLASRRKRNRDIRDFIPVHGKILKPSRASSSLQLTSSRGERRRQARLTSTRERRRDENKAPASAFSTGVRRKAPLKEIDGNLSVECPSAGIREMSSDGATKTRELSEKRRDKTDDVTTEGREPRKEREDTVIEMSDDEGTDASKRVKEESGKENDILLAKKVDETLSLSCFSPLLFSEEQTPRRKEPESSIATESASPELFPSLTEPETAGDKLDKFSWLSTAKLIAELEECEKMLDEVLAMPPPPRLETIMKWIPQ